MAHGHILISVIIPEPADVLPLLDAWVDPLHDALREGIDYADGLQPDENGRDPWHWSHCARFGARQGLIARSAPITHRASNTAIHLRLEGGLHKARVLRTLRGTAPHPSRNKMSQAAWVGVSLQGQLAFPGSGGELPPLSLLLDWQVDQDDEPLVHCSLPIGPWRIVQKPSLHWRVPLRRGASSSGYDDLRFDPGDDGGLPQIVVDPTELDLPESH